MTPGIRPCLNRGENCRDLPGHCYTTDGKLDQTLLHAHWGMRPNQCRVCGNTHEGEPHSLCTRCLTRTATQAREARADRRRVARLSNPHLNFTKLTANEQFRLEYEEVT